MARGRMVSKKLSTSRKFAHVGQAAGEFPQLLFPLLVIHADDFGRQAGDAFTVKHSVFPTSPRTEPEFEAALVALEVGEMITRYDSGGQSVIEIVKFEEHQQGLHKRTKSEFPGPPPTIPGRSGKLLEIPSEENRTEEKRREPNQSTYCDADAPPFPQAVENTKNTKPASTWKRSLRIAHEVIEAWPAQPGNWSPELKTRLQEQHFDPREFSPRGGQLFHDALEFAVNQRRERGESIDYTRGLVSVPPRKASAR